MWLKKVKEVGNSLVITILFLLFVWLLPKIKGGRTEMKGEDVKKLLKKAFGKKCTLFLTDLKYYVPTLASFKKFLEEDKTNMYKYVREYYDCDDFAYRLMGQFSIPGWADITFGIACSQMHAYNCLIAQDWEADGHPIKVYYVEPQNDRVVPVDKIEEELDMNPYDTVFVMM